MELNPNVYTFVWWPARYEWWGKVAVCLQRIIMFTHFWSDQTCRSEVNNAPICLPVELFHANHKTDCWITIKVNLKYFFFTLEPALNHTHKVSHSINCLHVQLFNQIYSLHLFILHYWISVCYSLQLIDIWQWIEFPYYQLEVLFSLLFPIWCVLSRFCII
jgi:hypothetical protein